MLNYCSCLLTVRTARRPDRMTEFKERGDSASHLCRLTAELLARLCQRQSLASQLLSTRPGGGGAGVSLRPLRSLPRLLRPLGGLLMKEGQRYTLNWKVLMVLECTPGP